MPVKKKMGWLVVFHCYCFGCSVIHTKSRAEALGEKKEMLDQHNYSYPKHKCKVDIYHYLSKE